MRWEDLGPAELAGRARRDLRCPRTGRARPSARPWPTPRGSPSPESQVRTRRCRHDCRSGPGADAPFRPRGRVRPLVFPQLPVPARRTPRRGRRSLPPDQANNPNAGDQVRRARRWPAGTIDSSTNSKAARGQRPPRRPKPQTAIYWGALEISSYMLTMPTVLAHHGKAHRVVRTVPA